MGRCDRAPAAMVGHHPIGRATVASISRAVAEGQTEAHPPDSVLDFEQYQEAGGYRLLRDCLEGQRDRDEVIAQVGDSQLRGLGGAGFRSGMKWSFVRQEAKPRLMAVNADEGEPGTFKDRHLLETDPHRVLEGMLIAAWAVEAEEVYFYLRDEYPQIRELLLRELPKLAASGLTDPPRVHLRRGAGAYICGEETAMLESLEGKRGYPRHKPPFPTQVGLFGRPTLIHNVETLYWVRDLIERGPAWYASQGCRDRKGLRQLLRLGAGEASRGWSGAGGDTARELIEDYCGGMLDGHTFKGYLPGGASGGLLPASLADLPLDFGTLEPHGCFIGSAAVVVFSDQDSARDIALNLMRFFEHESCGQCTPCRCGTEKAARLMERPAWDLPLLEELSGVHARRLDLRAGPGGAEPIARGHPIVPGGSPMTEQAQEPVRFTLDGREVEAQAGETIWQVARREGIAIPHLCYSPAPGYRPDGNCRACMVEIEGERVLAASCIRRPAEGMTVATDSRRAGSARALVFELLLADQPRAGHRPRPRREVLAVGRSRGGDVEPLPVVARIARTRPQPPGDGRPSRRLHPVRALRAGLSRGPGQRRHRMAYRGHAAKVVFDFDDPMGQSTCVACGECVQACPTGALLPASVLDEQGLAAHRPDRNGREPLPVLRRRLPDDLPPGRRPHPLRQRPRRPGESQPALRQGAVRV